MLDTLKIGLIGCGLIGERRLDVAAKTGLGRPHLLFDVSSDRAQAVSKKLGVGVAHSAGEIIENPDIAIVIVATPNHCLAELGVQALKNGKHALLEKPGAVSLSEIEGLIREQQQSGRVCKIGYNHRFHPAAIRLLAELAKPEHGRLLWVRGAYGHGGRPGYEKEWRFDRTLSGGGEIIDQGVHLLDLLQGCSRERFGFQFASRLSAFYPSTEEDNGFLVLQSPSGAVAQLHCSVTQWKNLFRIEAATEKSLFHWEGLGNPNYGEERLTIYRRQEKGGAPEREVLDFGFCGMESWEAEWSHFYQACERKNPKVQSSVADSRWVFETIAKAQQTSSVFRMAGK